MNTYRVNVSGFALVKAHNAIEALRTIQDSYLVGDAHRDGIQLCVMPAPGTVTLDTPMDTRELREGVPRGN